MTGIVKVLTDAGCHVVAERGWESRGRELATVNGIVWHHTATGPQVADSSVVRVLRDGRAGIPGPLSQLGLTRDGTWRVIASGRANHAGRGSWPGLSGNDDCLGVEAFYSGTSAERWERRQVDALRVGTAAIARAYDVDPTRSLIGHKEWAPRRKIDPYGLDMDDERRTVDTIIRGADDMADYRTEPAIWARAAWDKAMAAGILSQDSIPGQPVSYEVLAVLLDRAGVLDGTAPTGGHTHTATVRLK